MLESNDPCGRFLNDDNRAPRNGTCVGIGIVVDFRLNFNENGGENIYIND